MSEKKEYIERWELIKRLNSLITTSDLFGMGVQAGFSHAISEANAIPAADVEPVVRCEKCRHGIPFDRNSEMDESMYLNCAIGRGVEMRNVWHKYKKYYKDYSVVDRGGFCDWGEAGEPGAERSGSGE